MKADSLPHSPGETYPIDEIVKDARNGVSPWIQRLWLIALLLAIFTFIVSIKLDDDLPGSWWAVFSPLFVLQGIFGTLVFLYFIRIHVIFKNGVNVDIPTEATIYQALLEAILIILLYLTEVLLVLKITNVATYGWTIPAIPVYVLGGIFIGYYTLAFIQPKWFTSTQHFAKHSIDKITAYSRGLAVVFVMFFIILLNLRLDGVVHIWMWVIVLPLVMVFIIVLRWCYEYMVGDNVKEFTGFEVVAICAVILPFAFGIILICAQVDGTIDWSWFGVLMPITTGFAILFLASVLWICVAHSVSSKSALVKDLFSKDALDGEIKKKYNLFDGSDDESTDEELNEM